MWLIFALTSLYIGLGSLSRLDMPRGVNDYDLGAYKRVVEFIKNPLDILFVIL